MDPSVGVGGNAADFRDDFGEVLVLTEDESDIELVGAGHVNNVEREPKVDAFFARDVDGLGCAIEQDFLLWVVSKVAFRDVDTSPVHGCETARPVVVPAAISGAGGNASVEADLRELPALGLADGGGKCARIVVGVKVTEGRLRMLEKVLAVEEGDGIFRRWFGALVESQGYPVGAG